MRERKRVATSWEKSEGKMAKDEENEKIPKKEIFSHENIVLPFLFCVNDDKYLYFWVRFRYLTF